MPIEIPEYDFRGIKKIEIPKIDADFKAENNFGIEIIQKFLPQILKDHRENAKKIDYFYNYYLGEQDIERKQRLYNKDSANNNKVVENHAFRIIDFKTSFLTGGKRKYVYKNETDNNSLTYFERYLTDCDFYAKDTDLKEWIFATGIGCTYLAPRTDIIKNDGIDKITGIEKYKYKSLKDGYNVETESPFEFYTIDPRRNFVVYSSAFSKEPLFCVSIVDIDVSKGKERPKIQKQITIETQYMSMIITSDNRYARFVYDIDQNTMEYIKNIKEYNYLPIIEHSAYNSRIGIIELCREIFNSINNLKSSIADMIVDKANAILVFKNTDITSEQVLAMKKAGAIIINDNASASSHNVKADLDTITMEIPFEGLNTYYNDLVSTAYDIAGVPLASNTKSHTGDTGSAQSSSAGWDNAQIILKGNISTLLSSDYQVLKLMLYLSRLVPNSPIGNISASEIDIKYNYSTNYNFVNKAQGLQYLHNINIPYKRAVEASGLWEDSQTVGKEWEDNEKQMLIFQNSLKQTETIDVVKTDDNTLNNE